MTPIEILPIPLIMGLTEALKQFGVPNRMLPLINIALGIMYVALVMPLKGVQGVFIGIAYGLTAGGLYRSQKVVRGID